VRRDRERDRGVFVPAVVGAGLVFSFAMLVVDTVQQVVGRRHRRGALGLCGVDVARQVLGHDDPGTGGVVPGWRRTALLLAAICLGVAGYVAPGAWFNYVRPRGYVADAAWVLALALVVAVVAGLVGVVLGRSALHPTRWPAPARHAVGWVRRVTNADVADAEPTPATAHRWQGPAALCALVIAVAAGLWTLAVAMGARMVQQWDDRWLDSLGGWDDAWTWAEPWGRTEVAAGLAVVMVLVVRRRARRLVVAHAAAVAVGATLNVLVKFVVDRPRPEGAGPPAGLASYPSGHALQAVVAAMFVTAAVWALGRRRLVTVLVAVGLGSLAALCAIGRVVEGAHWPSDALGGGLLGAGVGAVGLVAARPARSTVVAGVAPHVVVQVTTLRSQVWARRLVLADVVALAALIITVGVPSNPEATLSVERLQQGVQLGLLGVVLLGWLLSWWWVAGAAGLLAVAGTAMAWFAALEYRPGAALGIAVAFLAPAFLLWWSWQGAQRPRALVTLAVATTVALSAVWVGASTVHDRYFGPTHPSSSVALPPAGDVEWIWTGNLSPGGFGVVAAVRGGEAEFLVDTDPSFTDPTVIPATRRTVSDDLVGATVDGLSPGTRYHVAVSVGGRRDERRTAQVRTPLEGAQSFRVAFASCARTASNGSVFDAIRAADPLLYVIAGDAHYGDIARDDAGSLLEVWQRTLTAPAQQALYQRVPVAYVWDDHDYGGNDADASSPARTMAQRVYRDLVPHPPLERPDDIGQSFVIGRLRFVLTDTRSHRRPAGDGSGTLLGAAQEAWLIDEARAAGAAGQLLVWVSPTPWIGTAAPSSDTWAGFAEERRRVADALVVAGVDDMVMLAGDAHMLAIDDGTHSDYTTAGGGGFPVAHGSALDRRGSVKGGPYSEGTYPGGGQFGLMDVVDDGGSDITVILSGWNWRGERLVELPVTFDLAPTGGGGSG